MQTIAGLFSSAKSTPGPEHGVKDQKAWVASMSQIDRARLLMAINNRVWNDLGVLDLLVDKKATLVSPLHGEFTGPDGFRDYLARDWKTFSPSAIAGEPITGPTRNSIVVPWHAKGTFSGDFEPEKIPATGKEIRTAGLTCICFAPDTELVMHVAIHSDGDHVRKQMKGTVGMSRVVSAAHE